MKISDYVANFFSKRGVSTSFGVTGGASLHLIDSFSKLPGNGFVPLHHEQSAAMCADGYSRVTCGLSVAIGTSGPGATNLITGIAGAYYDSVPVVFLTGQVGRSTQSKIPELRQLGFQETPIVQICKPITKYAVLINEPNEIITQLNLAVEIALSGRRGPVLIDIPDDIQRCELDLDTLVFRESCEQSIESMDIDWDLLINKLQLSQRPLLIIGWGVNLENIRSDCINLIEKLNIPVVFTWAATDLLPAGHPLRVGTFGTHGTRTANFAIHASDFVLTLGTRLDTKATGSPSSSFAPNAWKAVVDIDTNELEKFQSLGLEIDMPIHANLKSFITEFHKKTFREFSDKAEWFGIIRDWSGKYSLPEASTIDIPGINPYNWVISLSKALPEKSNLFVDTGCGLAWVMQAFEPKIGTRIWHDFNNTAMGWALPAAIGGYYAQSDSCTICVAGDGSLMMNVQELATVALKKLNIIVVCLNNHGYSMIRKTQDQWLNSSYAGSSESGGLIFPSMIDVAKGFGFDKVIDVQTMGQWNDLIKSGVLDRLSGPVFINVEIHPSHGVVPRAKFGHPNYDLEPALSRDDLEKELIYKLQGRVLG